MNKNPKNGNKKNYAGACVDIRKLKKSYGRDKLYPYFLAEI